MAENAIKQVMKKKTGECPINQPVPEGEGVQSCLTSGGGKNTTAKWAGMSSVCPAAAAML